MISQSTDWRRLLGICGNQLDHIVSGDTADDGASRKTNRLPKKERIAEALVVPVKPEQWLHSTVREHGRNAHRLPGCNFAWHESIQGHRLLQCQTAAHRHDMRWQRVRRRFCETRLGRQ